MLDPPPKQGYSSLRRPDMPSKCYQYVCCNPCCQRDDRSVNPNGKKEWRAAGKRCGSDDKLCRDWFCGDCGRDGYTGPAVKHGQPPDENWLANALPTVKPQVRRTAAQVAAAEAKGGGSSEYRGVYWQRKTRKWVARIRLPKVGGRQGQLRDLGRFTSERAAARAFDAAVRKLGKGARRYTVNFPTAAERDAGWRAPGDPKPGRRKRPSSGGAQGSSKRRRTSGGEGGAADLVQLRDQSPREHPSPAQARTPQVPAWYTHEEVTKVREGLSPPVLKVVDAISGALSGQLGEYKRDALAAAPTYKVVVGRAPRNDLDGHPSPVAMWSAPSLRRRVSWGRAAHTAPPLRVQEELRARGPPPAAAAPGHQLVAVRCGGDLRDAQRRRAAAR